MQLVRVVRQLGESPSSCYSSELLRSLCSQITIAFDWPCSATDFELSALSSCFGELLRMVESDPIAQLVIVLDDLQRIQSGGSGAALLSWFPCALPSNIHLICSINQSETSLLDTLRARISNDHFVALPAIQTTRQLSHLIAAKLRDQQRQLTSTQMQTVLQRFQRHLQPEPDTQQELILNSPMPSPQLMGNRVTPELLRMDSVGADLAAINASIRGDRSKSIGDATRSESTQPKLADTYRSLSDASKPYSDATSDIVTSTSTSGPTANLVHTPATPSGSTSSADLSLSEPISPMLVQLLVDGELSHWSSDHVCTRPDQLPASVGQLLSSSLAPLERMFGVKMLAKLCAYLACSRYGLREIELHELITSEDTGSCNGARIWLHIKYALRPFLRQVFILGRPYLQWAHSPLLAEVRRRYVRNEQMRRRIHNELANAFYLGFTEVSLIVGFFFKKS